MTFAQWTRAATLRIRGAGFEDAPIEAELLLGHALGLSRSAILAHALDPLGDPGVADALLARRVAGEPLAYILGHREFYGREFLVGPGVLVPRQETEVLVMTALNALAQGARVLDLGTGSGCIAAALALERRDLRVTAVDRSPEALTIAKANARALRAKVRFVLGDACSAFCTGTFDAVVTNPPYVGHDDPLPRDVLEWEPPEALFAGPDGLDFYRRLAAEVPRVLRAGGYLLGEVGDDQAPAVLELFMDAGWAAGEPVRDLGGVERVVMAWPGGLVV